MLPEILDITAGYRAMWKGKQQNVLFLDRRKEVKPDIIASNEFLPFKEKVFIKVVYDPPHTVGTLTLFYTHEPEGFDRYSHWDSKPQFFRNIIRVNKEVGRVLKDTGIFLIKWCDLTIKHGLLIRLMDDFKLNRKTLYQSGNQNRSKKFFLYFTQKTNHFM